MKSRGVSVGFLDFALNLACILLAIMVVSTIEEAKKSEGSVTPKAEFLIEMTWPDGSQNDMDLYVRAPNGEIVYFKNMRTPLMFLDVDNLGVGNTYMSENGSSKAIPARVEITTIRGIVPGRYTVNVHEYRQNVPGIEAVRVKVTKLNPYSVISDSQYSLNATGAERTFVNFTVNDAGAVTSIDASQVRLVSRKEP